MPISLIIPFLLFPETTSNNSLKIHELGCYLADGFKKTNIDRNELLQRRDKLDILLIKMLIDEKKLELRSNADSLKFLKPFILNSTSNSYANAPVLALSLSLQKNWMANSYFTSYFITTGHARHLHKKFSFVMGNFLSKSYRNTEAFNSFKRKLHIFYSDLYQHHIKICKGKIPRRFDENLRTTTYEEFKSQFKNILHNNNIKVDLDIHLLRFINSWKICSNDDYGDYGDDDHYVDNDHYVDYNKRDDCILNKYPNPFIPVDLLSDRINYTLDSILNPNDNCYNLNSYIEASFLKKVEMNLWSVENFLNILESYAGEVKRQYRFYGYLFPDFIFPIVDSGILPYLGPLTEWLLQQEKNSVDIEEIYDAALLIYQDAWAALAAITVIMWIDVGVTSTRTTDSILASKMNLFHDFKDPYGAIYHFWGYLFHTLRGEKNLKLFSLSMGYEGIVNISKGRLPDWNDMRADIQGIRLGRKIIKAIERPEICRNDAGF